MFLDLGVGSLTEPLSGLRWDRARIQREYLNRLAHFQQHGLASNDLVFMHYGNTAEFFVDLLAIWTLGCCAVPIDPQLSHFEVETLARAVTPKFYLYKGIVEAPLAAKLSAVRVELLSTAEPIDRGVPAQPKPIPSSRLALDRPALILFTSGTTGQPKGVVHTHRSLRARWMSLRQCLGLEKFRRTLCLLPTHFGHGLICNCLFPWLSGQDLFIVPQGRPDLIVQLGPLLDEHEITFMSSVPSIWRLALKVAKPPRLKLLQQVFCGSAPLSAHLWQQIQEWTGTRNVLNAYGITETGSWVAGTTVPYIAPEDGLIGVPWGAVIKILKGASTDVSPGMQAEGAVGEPGYVWINTPGLMQGYIGRDDLTDRVVAQGWFVTGDIGFIDDRGLLYLRGREREEINKGGMKIYPSDVDAVADRCEHVLDVCTFGYEDTLHGENVGIAFALKSPDDDAIGQMYSWLADHLAKHQMPQRWYLLDEIPRTSRGKINRPEIAQRCAALEPLDHHRLIQGKR